MVACKSDSVGIKHGFCTSANVSPCNSVLGTSADSIQPESDTENREKITNQVSQLQLVFKELNRKNAVLKQDLEPFAEKIIQYLDEENGGFKGAPKFPQFYVFETLFYFYKKNNKEIFLTPVEKISLLFFL